MTDGRNDTDLRKVFARNLHAIVDRNWNRDGELSRIEYLADQARVSVSTAGKWLGGKGLPEPAHLQSLTALFRVSFDDLLATSGAACSCAHGLDPVRPLASAVLRRLGAGAGASSILPIPSVDAEFPVQGGHYFVPVDDSAMTPFVVEGDIAIVSSIEPPLHDGVFAIRDRSGATLVRTVSVIPGEQVAVFAPNVASYKERVIPLSHISFTHDDFQRSAFPDAVIVLGSVRARVLIKR